MTDQPTTPDRPDPGAPGDDTPTVAFSPPPVRRPEWAQSAWLDNPEPIPAATQPVSPIAPSLAGATPDPASQARQGGGGHGLGQVLGVALLSAVLASGGTVVVLEGTGVLNHPAGAASSTNVPAASHGTVAIDDSSAVIEAAAKVSPAVVRITASGTSTDVFGGTIPETGVGSGIIFDAAGWILTNRHVVLTQDGSTASSLTVELKDGRQFKGTVYGIDTLTDLAIVKVDASGLPAAPIGKSADIKVGQLAIAIGSPLGTYTSTVTTGIISATGRTVLVEANVRLNNLIQTDAAINPGNSGGPLLNAAGEVIGINTAVEQGSNGLGFAIPIDIARPIMVQALAGQQLARPYIGIRFQQIDYRLQTDKHLSVDHGALIGPGDDGSDTQPGVTPGSPGDKAGLKDGDIILSIEGQAVDSEHPLDAMLTSYAPGQTVTLQVLRGSDHLDLKVTLGTRPKL